MSCTNENLSSSEGSADEEEILQNFDREARLIVQTETLPKKSSERYLLVYNTYKIWQQENRNLLSNSEENNLIVYFNSLKEKVKPPTLWSIWSMLRSTLNTRDNVDITKFLSLKSILKNYNKGYIPKKSLTLKWTDIVKFMTTADDHVYLAKKVILVFGICGALRCDEICNMKLDDVEDLGDKFLVKIIHNKNEYPGQFVIGELFYDTVKKYILLRPSGQYSDRFFIQYHKGKCTRQVIGKHKLGEVPECIASYLNLDNAKNYTGHCFRRTAATLLSESGANMQMIKQLGRWRSDLIAQGYIENSIHNKQLIFNGIIQASKLSNSYSHPSTSTNPNPALDGNANEHTYNDLLNCSDLSDHFQEQFTANKSDLIPGGNLKAEFKKANNKKVLTPLTNQLSSVYKKKLFSSKSPVKLQFQNEASKRSSLSEEGNFENQDESNNLNNSTTELTVSNKMNIENHCQVPKHANPASPANKKRSLEDVFIQDDHEHQDEGLDNILNPTAKKYCNFNNCTFHSFVINFTQCQCDK